MAQKRVKDYSYIKRSDISVLKATIDGKVMNVDPKKILSGTYVAGKVKPTAKKLRAAKIDPFKLKEKIFAKAKEIMAEEYEAEYENFVLAKDLKAFIECGLTEEMIMAFYLGFRSVVEIKADGEYNYSGIDGIFGYRTDGGYIERAIERAIYNCENKCFELGFKYPEFNWKKAGMKVSKTEVIETPEYEFMGKNRQDILKVETFTVKTNFKVIAVKSVGLKENGKIYEGSSYGTPEDRDPKKPLELNGGYLALVSRNAKDLFALAKKLLGQSESYVKDFDWLIQTKTDGARSLNESGFKYAKGGAMIEINEDGSNLPKPLYDLFSEWDEDADPYIEAERMRERAAEIGYEFDYDLSGAPTEFRAIKMAKGGAFWDKVKSGAKYTAQKGKEYAHKAKEAARKQMHNAKKAAAMDVLAKVKADTPQQEDVLDEAMTIVRKNYQFEPKPMKANAGAYIAIAEKAKGLAPKTFDAADTKVANRISKKSFMERMSETGNEEYDRDAYQANTEFAKGGGVEIYKLNKTLKAKLNRINKHLNKFGGRSLTEKEAIRFNIDNNAQSGFQAGEAAFNLANASYYDASRNYYYWIGDGLIDISEQVTGVPYDSYDFEIEKLLENSPYKMAKGGNINDHVDSLKKGDTLKMKFGSSISSNNEVELEVRSRNKVRNGTIDKITFVNKANPKGVKYYAYNRGKGWSFAKGDMGISNIEIFDKGGNIGKYDPIKNRPVTYVLKNAQGKEVFKTKSGNKASDERVSRYSKGEETRIISMDSKGNTRELFKLQSEEKKYRDGGNTKQDKKEKLMSIARERGIIK